MGAVSKIQWLFILVFHSAVALTGQQMHWIRLAEDSVYYANEYLPDRLMVTMGGPAQSWNFRSLKAPYAISRRIVLTGERDGKAFANMLNGNQTDAVLEISGKNASVVQWMGSNPVCQGARLVYTVSPAYIPFFNGVLGEQYTYRGKMVSTFAWPRTMSCAWSPSDFPDSCRVTYSLIEHITVDGEGTLYLPTESNQAYRQRISTRRALQVEVKNGSRWRDVTTLIPGVRLLTTTHVLRFVAAGSGLPLAEIELKDGTDPVRIEFKTHPMVTRIFTEEPVRPDIFVYPNPSYDLVRFQLSDLVHGRYKLTIFNILGVQVKEVDIEVDSNRRTLSLDLSELQRGTYLCRLQDRNGRSIKTKRLVLIQP